MFLTTADRLQLLPSLSLKTNRTLAPTSSARQEPNASLPLTPVPLAASAPPSARAMVTASVRGQSAAQMAKITQTRVNCTKALAWRIEGLTLNFKELVILAPRLNAYQHPSAFWTRRENPIVVAAILVRRISSLCADQTGGVTALNVT